MNGDSIFSVFHELVAIHPAVAQIFLFSFVLLFLTVVSRLVLSVIQSFFFRTVPAFSDYMGNPLGGSRFDVPDAPAPAAVEPSAASSAVLPLNLDLSPRGSRDDVNQSIHPRAIGVTGPRLVSPDEPASPTVSQRMVNFASTSPRIAGGSQSPTTAAGSSQTRPAELKRGQSFAQRGSTASSGWRPVINTTSAVNGTHHHGGAGGMTGDHASDCDDDHRVDVILALHNSPQLRKEVFRRGRSATARVIKVDVTAPQLGPIAPSLSPAHSTASGSSTGARLSLPRTPSTAAGASRAAGQFASLPHATQPHSRAVSPAITQRAVAPWIGNWSTLSAAEPRQAVRIVAGIWSKSLVTICHVSLIFLCISSTC